MRMKKGLISVSTIVVVILGVFFALRFIGGRESATNVKTQDDSIVQSSNEPLANENEESNISTIGVQDEDETSNISTIGEKNEIEKAQEESTNEMDVAYINDKTNVGIYTVKNNDTMFSIVKTYMPSHDKMKIVDFVKNRNGIDESYEIKVGQKIVIPYELAIETATAVGSEVTTNEYIIKKQDTLTSIAKNNMPSYGIKQAIEMIKETNKIKDENNIKEGTHLYIPK